MKIRMVRLMIVCLLGIISVGIVFASLGCGRSDEANRAIHSACVFWNYIYAGNQYILTDVVASQDVDGDTPSNVIYIGPDSVYMIQGLDVNEAIALKIARSSGYWYWKYERLYGQQEPVDFTYQGTDYNCTGEILYFKKAGAETSDVVSYLSSVVYQDTTYDVYSLQGVDVSQAIALRIVKAGKTAGFYNYYFEYQAE